MRKSKHCVLLVQGLNDDIAKYDPLIWLGGWKKAGFDVVPYRPHWHDTEAFEQKILKFIQKIETLKKQYDLVSAIGCSAGGSLVLNAVAESEKLHKGVNNCGRLRRGHAVVRSFERMTKSSPAFARSVVLFEDKNEGQLSQDRRRDILTLKPLGGDELVPADTVSVRGARNSVLFSIEHGFSIGAALTIYSPVIKNFLKEI